MKTKITFILLIFFTILSKAQCYTTISVGFSHVLALKPDGTLWAWGDNNYSQLGDGTVINRTTPVQIGTATNWAKIEAGDVHSFGIKTDGTLWGWGDNFSGELGDNTTISKNIPTQIGTATNWKEISPGGVHTISLKTDGTLWTWGDNGLGQLGDGTTASSLIPKKIGTDTNWTAISAGYTHSFALKSDGTLRGWGQNTSGQVGDGTFVNKYSPTLIAITGVQKFKAGRLHTLAIKDGTLWSWGNNSSGQLGDNTIVDKSLPTMIGTDTNWISVSATGFHSTALKATGTIWAWGNNQYGQLGDGTLVNKRIPTQIGTSTTYNTLLAGGYFTLAKSTGTIFINYLRTWGLNDKGQLGDGTLVNKSAPNLVSTCNLLLSVSDINSENPFSIYPNPVTDQITIQNKENLKIEKISILDASGKVIFESKNPDLTIDVRQLPTGVYFLKLSINNENLTKKFIKK